MVGTNKSLPSNNGTYLRKIRKPLIEKKRRERMNQSITQLRALIDDTVKQNVAPMTRVDKADILELTVCHLTKLRQKQHAAVPTDTRMSYAAGFQDCVQHVTSFLISNGLINGSHLGDLNRHLQNISRREPSYFIGLPASSNTSTPYRVQPLSTGPTDTPTYQVSPIQHHEICENVSPPYERIYNYGDSLMFHSDSPMSSSTESEQSLVSSTNSWSTEDLSIQPSYKDCRQTVRIGTGSENMIGHVIQETTWRPWK